MDVDLLELVIKTWKGSTEGKLVSVAQNPLEPEQSQGPREPFPLHSPPFCSLGLGLGYSHYLPFVLGSG